MDTFGISLSEQDRPVSLQGLAATIGRLARQGYVVALDEFQYFNRERLRSLFLPATRGGHPVGGCRFGTGWALVLGSVQLNHGVAGGSLSAAL